MALANGFALALERHLELSLGAVMRWWIIIGIGWLTATARGQAPALIWDAQEKECEVKAMAAKATFSFTVTNVSSKPVVIQGFHTSCGCTTVESDAFPWTLQPQEHKTLRLQSDIRGKYGKLTKSIVLETSAGIQKLEAKIHIPMGNNQLTSSVDRQAVFRGECATCHVTPTLAKMGRELYEAACAICHQPEQRATMVPDLRTKSIYRDHDYWRKWTERGREGTLMPAFSRARGGPLDEGQIESLVTYLTGTYRRTEETR
jgi:hypothetical protein